ncbi:hypothetical protein [Agrobacterium sp. NPDC090283]|uniref:hypothetical protein n=1 Tax=Agrobacterium sp. NPDC090283 TaxID=3363920 RepID=UPI00383A5825
MNSARRGVLAFLGGLVLARPSLGATPGKSAAFAESRSEYKPRHILCFLGPENGLAALQKSARAAIDGFAPDFSLDEDYSQDEPDDRMERSFNVCWDRVDPDAYQPADEEAIAGHGSVLYVLGPSMDAGTAVKTSTHALRFVQHMLDHGALAVKGESAGVAHGARRWKQLFEQSRSEAAANDEMALARICRLAFARRPIGGDAEGMTSVGFHLIGLPDVHVRFTKNGDQPSTNAEQLKIAALMDDIADQMARDGVDAVVKDRRASLTDDTRYEEDEYKFNPFGVVGIDDLKL